MVLELARDRALDGPVTGVVHSGRELVDEQFPMNVEELDGEDTRVLELVEELPDELLRRGLEPLRHTGRGSEAVAQDPTVVVVLDQWPARGRTVAPPDGEHRELAIERDVRLEDERNTPELRPRPLDVARFAQRRLPLAVVPAAARLEHGRQAELLRGAFEIGAVVDRREPRGSDPEPAAQLLLPDAVLRHVERDRGRQ